MRRVEEEQFPRQYYEREPVPQARPQSREYMSDYDYLYNEQPGSLSSASSASSSSSPTSPTSPTSSTSSTSSTLTAGEAYKKQAFEQRGKMYDYLLFAQGICWLMICIAFCLMVSNVFFTELAASAIDGLLVVVVILEVAKAARLRVAQNNIIIDLLAKIADKK